VTENGFEVLDMAPGVTLESLQACTDATLRLAS
jgi:acyl CoA:acetate/3-ketoacid CoA transferase beta subunit